jgi:hypothetical protein
VVQADKVVRQELGQEVVVIRRGREVNEASDPRHHPIERRTVAEIGDHRGWQPI